MLFLQCRFGRNNQAPLIGVSQPGNLTTAGTAASVINLAVYSTRSEKITTKCITFSDGPCRVQDNLVLLYVWLYRGIRYPIKAGIILFQGSQDGLLEHSQRPKHEPAPLYWNRSLFPLF